MAAGNETIKAWKRRSKQVREITLPSGLKAVIKRPSWMHCLKTGLLPSRMFMLATGMEEQKKNADGKADYRDTVEVMYAYALGGMVSPKVVLANPKEDEVGVEDIDDTDLVFIFTEVQKFMAEGEVGEGKALETFRDGTPSGDAGPAGAEVQPAAVGDPANK